MKLISLSLSLSPSPSLSLSRAQAKSLIYKHLDESDQHEVLLGSDHFTDFVEFLVSEKMLRRLLLKTLRVGRKEEARQLLNMYTHHHNITHTPGADPLQARLNNSSLSLSLSLSLQYIEIDIIYISSLFTGVFITRSHRI